MYYLEHEFGIIPTECSADYIGPFDNLYDAIEHRWLYGPISAAAIETYDSIGGAISAEEHMDAMKEKWQLI